VLQNIVHIMFIHQIQEDPSDERYTEQWVHVLTTTAYETLQSTLEGVGLPGSYSPPPIHNNLLHFYLINKDTTYSGVGYNYDYYCIWFIYLPHEQPLPFSKVICPNCFIIPLLIRSFHALVGPIDQLVSLLPYNELLTN
jgi:hypothetical protein